MNNKDNDKRPGVKQAGAFCESKITQNNITQVKTIRYEATRKETREENRRERQEKRRER